MIYHITVKTVFYPLFFQVSTPIASHMRMQLSQALTSFSVNFMLEVLLMTPVLNIPLSFLGDDPAIDVIHGLANTDLLPIGQLRPAVQKTR